MKKRNPKTDPDPNDRLADDSQPAGELDELADFSAEVGNSALTELDAPSSRGDREPAGRNVVPESTPVDTTEPTSRLESVQRQLEESVAREKRWLADLENYRRRTERLFEEQADLRKRALALDLLDIVDDLDRALDHATDTEAGLAQGVAAIRDKMIAVLERHGFKPFAPVNEAFDPSTQEAVHTLRHPELQNNTVAQVLRTGWTAGDKLLRPAQVVVVKNE